MRKILVIEDNADVRENIEEILELSGYNVSIAVNGIDGVNKAKEVQPDLIICDIMMPGMDGYSVLYALNKDEKLSLTPFVFLTAKSEIEDRRKGMRMGADDYLTKPFDESDLLMTVENRITKSERLKSSYEPKPEGIISLVKDALSEEEVLAQNYSEKYKGQHQLYHEGGIARHIYYLNSGSVKVFQEHQDGKELITDIIKPGSFFGFIPILMDDRYHTSAATLSECEITTIPIDQFNSLLRENADFRNRLFKVLSGNVIERENEMLEIAYGTVRKRVAEGLVRIWKKAGEPQIIEMSRDEIANVVGVATETLIRTLSDFKKEGLIGAERRAINMINPWGLAELKF
ncbi:MAG: response regulator [Flavobacteriales bacterium]|nr:response regulator [Flavobacteriales bacterium]